MIRRPLDHQPIASDIGIVVGDVQGRATRSGSPGLEYRRLTRPEMVDHAERWIDAWNRRDLDLVLEDFAENACFRSPVAALVTGCALLEGCGAMASYWRAGLARLHSIHFELLDVICDVERQSMVVHYLAALDGPAGRACEIFQFERGRKIYAEALYGDNVVAALSARQTPPRPTV